MVKQRVVMGRRICAALCLFLAMAGVAEARYAALVIDAGSGAVLHEENADTRNYPASLSKLMTLYLLFEAVRDGTFDWDTPLPVSARAAGQSPSKLGVRHGDHIRVGEAVDALIIRSANDVAVVVAEAIGGTEFRFAQLMTKRARQLGMGRTTFRNASGLPNRAQLSTARDMAVMALAMMRDFPDRYHLFSRTDFTHGGRAYTSHNRLLTTYAGMDGLKTGYTVASGYNIVTSAKRDGRRLVGVLFGGDSSRGRNRHMASLLDKGFARLRQTVRVHYGQPTPRPQQRVRMQKLIQAPASPVARPARTARVQPARAADKPASRTGPMAGPMAGSTAGSTALPVPRPLPAVAGRAEPADRGQPAAADNPGAAMAGWGVQVGAFFRMEDARRAVDRARNTLTGTALTGTVLTGTMAAAADIRPVQADGRMLFRARLAGMRQQDAHALCSHLHRLDQDCMIVTPAGGMQQVAGIR